MNKPELVTEWVLLQSQFDSYEKHSLIIKLFSVGLVVFAYSSKVISIFVVVLLMILWLQDAIWKTFQGRIETRLLQVETGISTEAGDNDLAACQFNSQYLDSRPGTVGLVVEYFKQGLRPTVAFPHCALVVMAIVELIS